MSDIVKPAPAAEPPQPQDKPKTLTQKLTQWFVAIALLVSGGLGLLKAFNQFTLPSCTSDRTSETLKGIFKSKNVEVSDISAMTSLTDTYSEKTCTAHVKATSEEANIAYRIYWDGWSATVMITKVN
jgi:hypothetical protein